MVNANEVELEELAVKLEKDFFSLQEITFYLEKIRDYFIKWETTQNPNLSSDSKEWAKENFEALKITLTVMFTTFPTFSYFQQRTCRRTFIMESKINILKNMPWTCWHNCGCKSCRAGTDEIVGSVSFKNDNIQNPFISRVIDSDKALYYPSD
ncbi:hypothetical protein Glove_621g12 [Diversispora epigaea]|uniref:Uncharacterized protein n=1 Tax=Diversispora epigaea TaxID=1348612 RepID=A0A397G975_9GLOM|nr:hypothetical protein Glove_621g12 [Diversispora epigaea]